MHEKSRKSSPPRSNRTTQFRNQVSQLDAFKIGKEGKISQAAKNWRDQLLASGPRRGVHFEVDIGPTTEVRAHHISSFPNEQCSGRIFFKCTQTAVDLAEYTDWIGQYYPQREEER